MWLKTQRVTVTELMLSLTGMMYSVYILENRFTSYSMFWLIEIVFELLTIK